MFREASRNEIGFADVWPHYWPRVRALMLRSYYDGSGKGEKNSSPSRFLTLAGIAAYDNLWADIETEWRGLLKKHGMSHIHMKDLVCLGGSFGRMSRNEAESAVGDFVALIGHLDQDTYHCYGCTLSLDDFRRAQRESEGLRNRKPADVCVNWCCGGLDEAIVINVDNRENGDDRMVLVFDVNEEFMKRIDRIWRAVVAKRSLKRQYPWAFAIASIVPLDSRTNVVLQVADVLAWNCNRHRECGDRDEWFSVAWRNWSNGLAFYDYDRVMSEYSSGVWVPPKSVSGHR